MDSPQKIYFIIYVSSATESFTVDELLSMLKKTRENNIRAGLTGMLLYKDGNFMQFLEGEEQTVRSVFKRIQRDPRHRGIITLWRGFSDTREFPDWSMGFKNLDSAGKIEVPGYNEFLNTAFTDETFAKNPSHSRRLLLSFKQHM